MVTLTHSLKGYDLHKAAMRFDDAVEAGVHSVGRLLDRAVMFEVARTYVRPIPTRAQVKAYNRGRRFGNLQNRGASKPAWVRTRELERGRSVQFLDRQTAEVAIRNTRAANVITNYPGGYAQHLHEYNPRNPAIGVNRRNQFFTAAATKVGPRVADTFQGGFDRTMG